jgi:hypothetical protein
MLLANLQLKIWLCCFGLFFAVPKIWADTMPSDSIYCDTLYTTDGNAYLVNIKNRNETNGDIRFTICGDESGALYTLTRKKIKSIHWAKNASVTIIADPNRPDVSDRLVRRAKTAFLLSWLSWIMASTFLLLIPGLIFALIALGMGEQLQRDVPRDHRWYDFIKKRSRNAVYIALGLFALIILALILL